MTVIAINQPRYLPSCNYIERMLLSDVHVMLDNVQHQKASFEHRNKIKTTNGPTWLSIPLNREKSLPIIKDLTLSDNTTWYRKHLAAFEMNYKRTKYFTEIYPLLEEYYSTPKETLNSVVSEMLDLIIDYLELNVNLIWASEFEPFKTSNDDLLVDIVKKLDGTKYISGPNGRNYIEKNKFIQNNIELVFHDYNHPEYKQLWGDFIPYMTIFDLMFYKGKNTKEIIMQGILNEQ